MRCRRVRPRPRGPGRGPSHSGAGQGIQVMLIYIHIGRWGVSASRVFWRLPPAHSCSSSARSWSYRASCHWQRALGSGQRPCSLDSSTLSGQLGLFGQRHAGGNMTSDSGAGSRADSSDSHTLGPSSSSCSLLDFDDSTRCARHRLLKPTCPDGLRRPLAGWFYRPPSCPTVAPSLVRRRSVPPTTHTALRESERKDAK